MSGPLEALRIHEAVFKFYGTFELDNASESTKFLMNLYTIGYQIVFTDLGFILFWSSLLISPSTKEKLQSLFVAFAYLNATFKAHTIYNKRKELVSLWKHFSNPDFKAKDHVEEE